MKWSVLATVPRWNCATETQTRGTARSLTWSSSQTIRLQIEPAKIITIKVLETIKDGKSIYRSDAPAAAAAPAANCAADTACGKGLAATKSFAPQATAGVVSGQAN
jgi:hypothetical protein